MSVNRIVFAVALVFVAMVAKSAGGAEDMDVCLRDEVTGEWLIGFMPDFAVYNNRYWSYSKAENGDYTLCCDGDTIDVTRRDSTVYIDGVGHRCTELTSLALPLYPMEDDTPFTDVLPASPDSVTVRVILRTDDDNKKLVISRNTFVSEAEEKVVAADSSGKLDVKFPSVCISEIRLMRLDPQSRKWYGILLYPEPGDTVVAYFNEIKKHFYVMGSNARLSNEMIRLPDEGKVSIPYDERAKMTAAQYIEECGKKLRRNISYIDTIARKRNTLSEKWHVLQRENSRAAFACGLTQMAYRLSIKEMGGAPTDTLLNGGYLDYSIPYLANSNINTIFNDFLMLYGLVTRRTYYFLVNEMAMRLEAEGEIKLTEDEKSMLNEMGSISLYCENLDFEDARKYQMEHDSIVKAYTAFYYRPDIFVPLREAMAECQMDIVNGIGLQPLTADMVKVRYFLAEQESTRKAFTPDMVKMITREILTPMLREYVLESNRKYL